MILVSKQSSLIIKNMNLPPKKSLGQHFLRSESALNKIIDAAELIKDDVVLEVGPGEGVLTEKLLLMSKSAFAIEKDSRAIEILQEKFKNEIKDKRLNLIQGDILTLNIEAQLLQNGYKVVANVPYYISGALIRYFLEAELLPESMTLLLQKEVVERIVAKDKKESILSMSVKAYGQPKMMAIVKAGSFFPPPKVDSAILHVSNISNKFFEVNDIKENKFFDILHAGFAHKRKLVVSNLKEKGFKYPGNLNQKARAENLALEDWAAISKIN